MGKEFFVSDGPCICRYVYFFVYSIFVYFYFLQLLYYNTYSKNNMHVQCRKNKCIQRLMRSLNGGEIKIFYIKMENFTMQYALAIQDNCSL